MHDTLPLLRIGHARSMLLTRQNILGLQLSPMGVETFKDVHATKWVYLPVIQKSRRR